MVNLIKAQAKSFRILFGLIFFTSIFLNNGGNAQTKTDYRQKIKEVSRLAGSNIEKADSLSENLLNNDTVRQNDTLLAKAYLLRGLVHYNQSKYQLAIYYFRKAENSAYAQSYKDFKAQALNNKGAVYGKTMQYDSAFIAYNQSMEIDKAVGHNHDIAETQLNQAVLAAKLGELAKADSLTKNAMAFFKTDKDSARIAKSYQTLGVIKRRQDQKQKAIQYQQQANELFRQIGYLRGRIETFANLSILHAALENFDKALAAIDSMDQLSQQYSDPAIQIEIPLRKARVLIFQEKTDQASKLLDSIEMLKPELIENDKLQYFYVTKLKLAAQKGDLETADKVFKRYADRKDSLNRAMLNQNIADLKVVHEVDKKNALLDKQEKLIEVKTRKNTWLTVALIIVAGLLITVLIFYQRNKLLHGAVTNLNISSKMEVKSSEEPSPQLDPKYHEIFQEAEHMIKDKGLYQNPDLSLKSLSQYLGTNEYYVSRAINEGSGMNFKGYLNNYRINLAKNLLITPGETGKSINEIAQEVGFSNSSSFNRTFKQLTGLTPSEYMALNRHNVEATYQSQSA